MGFAPGITFSFSGVRGHRVKTWVQDDLQGANVAFFTARNLAVPRESYFETAFDGPIGNDDFNRSGRLRAIPLVR